MKMFAETGCCVLVYRVTLCFTLIARPHGFYAFMSLICPRGEENSLARAALHGACQVQLFDTVSFIESTLRDFFRQFSCRCGLFKLISGK